MIVKKKEFEYISEEDLVEVYSNCIIGSAELETIFRLYQPLIGHVACALYFTLFNYSANNFCNDEIKHKFFFDTMQISAGNFLYARRSLEASGLIKTYRKKCKGIKKYKYILYAPKSVSDFFDDVLFYGQLVKYIGKQSTKKILSHYKNNIDLVDFENISANFNDIFNPDLDDLNIKLEGNFKDNKPINVNTNFSFDDFFRKLKECNISEKSLSSEECKKIEQISVLYGLNSDIISDIVISIYDETKKKGNRINLVFLDKKAREYAKYFVIENKNIQKKTIIKISGKTELASEMLLMEKLSPARYLQLKQDGAPPTDPDLKIISYLGRILKLNNAVINAILWISLNKFDNSLIKNYIEKIAGAIKREKINSAIDVINYVSREQKAKKLFDNNSENINNKKEENISESEKYDKDEYKKIIEKINKLKE